jgi:hypothetical protein
MKISHLIRESTSPLVVEFKKQCVWLADAFALHEANYIENKKELQIQAIFESPDKHRYDIFLNYTVQNTGTLTAKVTHGGSGNVEHIPKVEVTIDTGWNIFFGENYLTGHMNHEDLEGKRTRRIYQQQGRNVHKYSLQRELI